MPEQLPGVRERTADVRARILRGEGKEIADDPESVGFEVLGIPFSPRVWG